MILKYTFDDSAPVVDSKTKSFYHTGIIDDS